MIKWIIWLLERSSWTRKKRFFIETLAIFRPHVLPYSSQTIYSTKLKFWLDEVNHNTNNILKFQNDTYSTFVTRAIPLNTFKNTNNKTCTISFLFFLGKRFGLATCVGKKKWRGLSDLFIAPTLSSLAWHLKKLASYAYGVTLPTEAKNLYCQFLSRSAKTLRVSDLCKKEKV